MRAVGGAWCPPDEDSEALEAEAPEPAYPVGQYQRRPDKLQLMYTPRAWAERRYQMVYWAEEPRGGHFAAFEQPEAFARDIRAFGRVIRESL